MPLSFNSTFIETKGFEKIRGIRGKFRPCRKTIAVRLYLKCFEKTVISRYTQMSICEYLAKILSSAKGIYRRRNIKLFLIMTFEKKNEIVRNICPKLGICSAEMVGWDITFFLMNDSGVIINILINLKMFFKKNSIICTFFLIFKLKDLQKTLSFFFLPKMVKFIIYLYSIFRVCFPIFFIKVFHIT